MTGKGLSPHQIAVLSIPVDDLVRDAYFGFDLDTILPNARGGYCITMAPRVPAPRGPPKPSDNDIYSLAALGRLAAHNNQIAPRRDLPMTSAFALDDPPRTRKRKGPIPLTNRREPRLTSDESIGRRAILAGRVVELHPIRNQARRDLLKVLGRIWCAGEELTPSEVRAVLADACAARRLVKSLAVKPRERMEIYSHLNKLIADLEGRLQLRLFD